MSKNPAVNFYTSDFLIGTATFNNKQVGGYIRLLSYQHQLGHLKEEFIERILFDFNDEEKQQLLSKFSKDKNQLFFNKRMEKEIEKKVEYSKKQRENALKRWKNDNTNAMPTHIPNESQDKALPLENENENENIKEIIKEFNNIGLSKVTVLSKTRKDKLKLRLGEYGKVLIIDAIKKISKSKFLMGDNEQGWKCSFDWLIENDKNILKVYEGNYESKEKSKEIKPKWLNKKIEAEIATSEEQQEMENLLKEFR